MNRLWRRLLFLFRHKKFERDLTEEMRFHLEMKAQAHGGDEEARYRARREFGNTVVWREMSRELWGFSTVDRLWQDLRYGLRTLGKNPSFTLIAVLTLGAGIGVNTAVFTAFNAVALRPLEVPDPDRVVQIDRTRQAGFFSYPDYVYLRDNNSVFSATAAAGFFRFSMTGAPPLDRVAESGIAGAAGFSFPQMVYAKDAEPVAGLLVSGNYFQTLGVEPVLGRGFIAGEDDGPGAHPVLLISDNYWERRFARNPKLLGATLVMNGVAFTVIGITPRDFTGTAPIVPAVWAPLASRALLEPGTDILHDRAVTCCRLYARLRPGASQQEADAQMRALFLRLQQMFAGKNSPEKADHPVAIAASPFGAPDADLMATAAIVLAAVSMVLLIACANVAGLLLARSAARQKEIAIRLAIGASRGRLIRQLLTESALVSMMAGVTGMMVAWWTLHVLMVEISASLPAFWVAIALHLAPDLRVFAYMLLLSLMAGLAFGLAPALQASRPNLISALKEEGAVFGLRLRKSNLRNILVALQVSVSLVLLIGAGLLARGSERAFSVDLGFDYRRLISADVSAAGARYDPPRMIAIQRQLIERLEALPGVKLVSVASRAPLAGGNRSLSIGLGERPPNSANSPEAYDNLVSPDFFQTVGIPILHGRNFTAQEARDSDFDGAPVIVSEATARKFWPDQDPIGKRISFARPTGAFDFGGEVDPRSRASVVIGVAKDIRSVFLDKLDETCIYLPVSRAFRGSIVVRTAGDPKLVVAALGGELQAIDNHLEAFIFDFRAAFSNQPAFVLSRIGAIGSAIIGVLGLLMAAVGIYGMVGFAVSQRTHEVGVRMALGARSGDVLGLLLRETMRPVAIGLAAGFAGAAALSHLMSSLLFGLSALDPLTFLGVSAFLAAAALLAGFLPARRATKVDPMAALRYE